MQVVYLKGRSIFVFPSELVEPEVVELGDTRIHQHTILICIGCPKLVLAVGVVTAVKVGEQSIWKRPQQDCGRIVPPRAGARWTWRRHTPLDSDWMNAYVLAPLKHIEIAERAKASLDGAVVIVVDDGIAYVGTGLSTLRIVQPNFIVGNRR